MDMLQRLYLTIGSFLLCTVVSGCADVAGGVTKGVMDKIFEEDPPKIVMRIKATAGLNPDINGRPSPIVLRYYELKTASVFDNADFFALYEQDTDILGEEIKAREELEISPGESVEIEKELDMESRYIGVIAAYRDLDNAVWRGGIVTPPDETTYIDIQLGPLKMEVVKGEKKGWF
jgi:type VI secretion system protein VasD